MYLDFQTKMMIFQVTRMFANQLIEDSLTQYDKNITEYNEKLSSYQKISKSLKEESDNISKRFYVFDLDKRCDICSNNIFTDIFYTFNCNHSFHRKCIKSQLKEFDQMQKIVEAEFYEKAIIQSMPKYAEFINESSVIRKFSKFQ